MSFKRKKTTLILEQKAKILSKLDEGVQANRLALDFGVTKSAISYIKSKRDLILDAISRTYHESKKEDKEDIENSGPVVSYSVAIESANNLIKWCQKRDTTKHLSNVLALRNEIVISSFKQPKKQSIITDFMKKQ